MVDVYFNKHVSTNVCEYVVLSASCVLSPLLYILYSDDCRSNQGNSYLVRFADHSALLSLLLGTQAGHGASLDDFLSWCDKSCLT